MSQNPPEVPHFESMLYTALRSELHPVERSIEISIPASSPKESPLDIYNKYIADVKSEKRKFAISNGGSNLIDAITLTADNVGNGLAYHCSRGGSFLEPILYGVGALIVVGVVISALSLILSIALGVLAIYVIAKIAIAVFE